MYIQNMNVKNYNIPPVKLPNEGTFLDLAVQNVRKLGLADPDYVDQNERSLLIAGSSSSGKTTLVNKYLFGTDQRATSTAKLLDYYCSPTTTWATDDNYNNLCHVWELEDLKFESSLLMLQNTPKLSAVLCLDLSQPQFLYHTQDAVIKIFKNLAKQRKNSDAVEQERISQIPKNHPDTTQIRPFPIPLLVVGMKYDLFHRFEPEKKKVISQFIRYISHINGGHLFYWTDRNSEIYKQAKAILRYYAYGKDMSTTKKTDYNKALVVPPYSDKLSEIDSSGDHSLEKYRLLLEGYYPQENPIKVKLGKNPADDPIFAEPVIDLIRAKAQASWRSNFQA